MYQQSLSISTPSKYPQVRRDIAVLVDKQIDAHALLTTIRNTGGALLKETWLFDVYEGDKLPTGKRSLAFALIWQDEKTTLADEIVNQTMQTIIETLHAQYQAVLRD